MLGTLAGQPDQSAHGATAASQLVRAVEAAARACDRWREVEAAWNEKTTDTRGLTSPTVTDTSDLVVRLERLAFADPGWTPIRARKAPVRGIADLAPDSRQAAAVVGAIHHAADALACMATADLRAVDGAIRGSRIHVPTRTLPESFNVPHRCWNVTLAGEAALMDVYRAAVGASERLAVELDEVAFTMNTPSRIRAAARAAIRARETGSRETAHSRPAESATASSTELKPALSATPGPIEQAVRSIGGADVIVLMRARAMDATASRLIAEARDGARPVAQPGQEPNASPSVLAIRSEAHVARPASRRDSASGTGRIWQRPDRARCARREPRQPEPGLRLRHG